ncbi:MAG: beta-ketoacyl-ACP synthase II [Planctomycetes bacterium]|uniref:beta-ketoacyl-ACP synthase II n=1 Tax=Candidatus Wunengus californicus TaxID=3367619 RepID=UPI004024B51E|nr:beta-ketoacyl-ACP synthase II [Planctomycetota bacterium]
MDSHIKKNRVVVTGLGIITPIGIGVDAFWESIINGKSGISMISRFNVEGYPTKIAGEVKNFSPKEYMPEELVNNLSRYSQLGLAAVQMAVKDARLDFSRVDTSKVAVSIGVGAETLLYYDEKTAIENNNYTLRIKSPLENKNISNVISDFFHISGQNVIVATACSSGNQAIGIARDMIKSGQADLVLTGGVEAPIFPLNLAAFCSLRIMSKRNDQPEKASRPFDKDRDGFVMGEGAGILMLESEENACERGAHIYGEIAGYGATSDAFHMTMPSQDRMQICKAMRLAIDDAGLDIKDIDYINAHGTSTIANDRGETKAIKTVFGSHAYNIPVSSTKSMTGHLMGAAGAVELITCILAIKNGVLPPTINLEHADPECDLDYVANNAREKEINTALSNSFGFGGNNSTIVVKRFNTS